MGKSSRKHGGVRHDTEITCQREREPGASPLHARSLRTSPENASNLRLGSEGDSNPRCHENFDLAKRGPKLALFLPQPTTIMSAENIVAFRSLRFSVVIPRIGSPPARLKRPRRTVRIWVERKIGCLPVGENGRLVVILTEEDFVALIPRRGQ